MYKRKIIDSISNWIEKDEILIIMWARQVGKTSTMKYIRENLLKNKQVFWYNLEDFEILEYFNKSPKNLIKLLQEKSDLKEKVYVFIDEIQYLENPTNFLKYNFDEYKDKIKFIVSGSSPFYLDSKFIDSMSWRKKIFYLNPLCFEEYLVFKNQDDIIRNISNYSNLSEITKNGMNYFFDEYIKFGWYPKVTLENNYDLKKELIGEIINSYLKKDIEETRLSHPNKFYNLYKILSSNIWNLLNKNELANTLDLSLPAIEKYIWVMQKTFHFSLIKPYFTNIRKELTKMPKIYIIDNWIRNYLQNNFEDINYRVDKWAIFENIVFNELKNNYQEENIFYWRTADKQEVDFIIPSINRAIEIKYIHNNKKIPNLETFSKKYPNFKTEVIDKNSIFEKIISIS